MKPASSLLISLLKRSPRLKRLARAAIHSLLQENRQHSDLVEITPIAGQPAASVRPRLNLLVPTIAADQLFGGIATALHFFSELAASDFDLRVILTDNDIHEPQPPTLLAGWQFVRAEDSADGTRQITPFAHRNGRQLPVRRNDIFIASAWWTAYTGQRLIQWQAQHYACPIRPLVYLIQDFEPGFYPWSTRYLLAQSTYTQREVPLIAVFNTRLLQDYLAAQGFGFTPAYAFEPSLHPQLRQWLQAHPLQAVRKRQILFYGRPSVERNAFPLIVQGLRHWQQHDPRSANWKTISMGEPHPPVVLATNRACEVKGKLNLNNYANLMSESAIGISLMVSPHPSYPPLEMAAFGMRVITNSFGAKQLDQWSNHIYSLADPTPENLSTTLSNLIDRFEAQRQCWSEDALFANHHEYTNATQPAYPFREHLLEILRHKLYPD
jgi:hypothetical protein